MGRASVRCRGIVGSDQAQGGGFKPGSGQLGDGDVGVDRKPARRRRSGRVERAANHVVDNKTED